MRKILIISGVVISVIILFIVGGRIYTKSFSPEDQAMFKSGGDYIKVDYCRPSKKGRNIFGDLLPYGTVWRTGANEATVIELNKDYSVNGKILKAGKHSLFTIPGKDEWTIIFNEQTGQWGTIYNEDRDEMRTSVPSEKIENAVEKFTIEFEQKNKTIYMVLKWDDTQVKIPFEPVADAQ